MAQIESEKMILSGGGGVRGIVADFPRSSSPVTRTAASLPADLINFDLSPESIARAGAKGNVRSDILSAYQTYLTGTPTGRGGTYAVENVRRYGAANIREGAASYLRGAGLGVIADVVAPTPPIDPIEDRFPFFELPVPDNGTGSSTVTKNPVELLLDALPGIFGQAIQREPLQSQVTGFTPVSGDFGGGESTLGSGVGMWLILGGIAIAGYFIYRRFRG